MEITKYKQKINNKLSEINTKQSYFTDIVTKMQSDSDERIAFLDKQREEMKRQVDEYHNSLIQNFQAIHTGQLKQLEDCSGFFQQNKDKLQQRLSHLAKLESVPCSEVRDTLNDMGENVEEELRDIDQSLMKLTWDGISVTKAKNKKVSILLAKELQ